MIRSASLARCCMAVMKHCLNSGHFCPVQVSRRASIRVHNSESSGRKVSAALLVAADHTALEQTARPKHFAHVWLIFLICRRLFGGHFTFLPARMLFIHRSIASLCGATPFCLRRRRLPAYCCCFTFCQESIPSDRPSAQPCLANDSTRSDTAMTRA